MKLKTKISVLLMVFAIIFIGNDRVFADDTYNEQEMDIEYCDDKQVHMYTTLNYHVDDEGNVYIRNDDKKRDAAKLSDLERQKEQALIDRDKAKGKVKKGLCGWTRHCVHSR